MGVVVTDGQMEAGITENITVVPIIHDKNGSDLPTGYYELLDYEGIFFFLLGILGGVLFVVLGLIVVQQGKVMNSILNIDSLFYGQISLQINISFT